MIKKEALLLLCLTAFAALPSTAAPSFTKEADVRISSATPQAITGTYPNLRMFYLRDHEVKSSTSTDGISWGEEAGTRLSTNTTPSLDISSITALTILPLDAGGFRMLYSVFDTSGAFKIVSATST